MTPFTTPAKEGSIMSYYLAAPTAMEHGALPDDTYVSLSRKFRISISIGNGLIWLATGCLANCSPLASLVMACGGFAVMALVLGGES